MGSPERIREVARRIARFVSEGHQLVVVPSAMAGETNRLIGLARELNPDPNPRELDVIASTGEQVSIGLLALALQAIGLQAQSYTGWQGPIVPHAAYSKARIPRIRERILREARRLGTVTFEEMLELASVGSKVLQSRSVEFAGKYKVKLRVLSSSTDVSSTDMGTLITFEEDENMEQAIISGIAFNRDEAKITVLGVPDRPGIAFAILGPIADANIDVDIILQNASSEGLTDFSFTVHRNEYKRAMQILESKVKPAIDAKGAVGDDRIAKVSLVGIGMRTHAGIASKMFGARAPHALNIQLISTSQIKTSVVVDDKYMELAVRVLHRTFELEKEPVKETLKP